MPRVLHDYRCRFWNVRSAVIRRAVRAEFGCHSSASAAAPKGVTVRIYAEFFGIFKDKREGARQIFIRRLPAGAIDDGKGVVAAFGELQSVRKAVVHGGDISKTSARTSDGEGRTCISAEEEQPRIFKARL